MLLSTFFLFFSFVQLWLQMFFCLQKPSYVNQTNDKKTFWPGADQQQKIINKNSINFILRNHIVRTCFFNLMNISKLRSMCQQVNFCLYCCGNFWITCNTPSESKVERNIPAKTAGWWWVPSSHLSYTHKQKHSTLPMSLVLCLALT